MRITCPTCGAAYDVPAERLAGGRTVRCARCGSGWVPPVDDALPEPPLLAPPQAPEPPPVPEVLPGTPVPEPPETVVPNPSDPESEPPLTAAAGRLRQGLPIFLAWAASLVLLGAFVWAMIAWRTGVMRAWPPSERLYAALGLLRK